MIKPNNQGNIPPNLPYVEYPDNLPTSAELEKFAQEPYEAADTSYTKEVTKETSSVETSAVPVFDSSVPQAPHETYVDDYNYEQTNPMPIEKNTTTTNQYSPAPVSKYTAPKEEPREPSKYLEHALQIVAVVVILIVLVFLSIGIVRIVPKALNGLASASLSLGSLFPSGTSTPASNATSTFIIATSSTPISAGGRTTIQNPPQNNVVTVSTTTRPTNTSGQNTYHVVGNPDLTVTILSQGVIDPRNGNYIPSTTAGTNDTAYVKFKISNIGSGPSGTWSLKVVMPSTSAADQLRQVNNIGSLGAGNSVTGEARFDKAVLSGSDAVTITADNLGTVQETNESNNTGIAYFSVSGSSVFGNGNNGGSGTIGTVSTIPDLAIQITDVGILDNNNNFVSVPEGSLRTYNRIALKFNVLNQGQQSTGAWYLRADLNGGNYSTYNGYNSNGYYNSDGSYTTNSSGYYNSNSNYNNGYSNGYYNGAYSGATYGTQTYTPSSAEMSLSGGTSLSYIISFDNVSAGNNNITITLDSRNNVYESNENNNSQTVNFYVNN